jgi:hypothetical protein
LTFAGTIAVSMTVPPLRAIAARVAEQRRPWRQAQQRSR